MKGEGEEVIRDPALHPSALSQTSARKTYRPLPQPVVSRNAQTPRVQRAGWEAARSVRQGTLVREHVGLPCLNYTTWGWGGEEWFCSGQRGCWDEGVGVRQEVGVHPVQHQAGR